MRHANQRNQQGSFMIEILVTVVIVAIGFLGIGAMQLTTLKNVNSSHQRYMATLYAYDIVERMRSNIANIRDYHFEVDGSESAVGCSSACNVLNFDRYEWGQQLSNNLPSGRGSVQRELGAEVGSNRRVITIEWLEQHSGQNIGTADGVAEDHSFTLEVVL